MKKWYAEEYEWETEVIGFLRSEHTERYCRNGEEIGDKYTCTYGCPVNADGQGICSKVMMTMFPIMEAVRSGGDLENIGGNSKYSKEIVCPDGCVIFRMTAKKLGNENFYKGKFFDQFRFYYVQFRDKWKTLREYFKKVIIISSWSMITK